MKDKEKQRKDVKDLRELVEAHWNTEISSLALKNLKENHWVKPAVCPRTSNVSRLHEYLKQHSEIAFQKLQAHENVSVNYVLLCRCVLLMTMIFNRRRPAETECLRIVDYERNYDSINSEEFALTPLEKILVDKFKRVIAGGKGTKPVPFLFSKKMQRFVKFLLEIRQTFHLVPEENPYVFAVLEKEDKHMNGYDIMRKFAMKCGAEQPQLLTPTRIRKHMATTLQVMHLEEDEMEQVATFMGHTKKTHSEFYR